jgi:hypothetical protein
MVKTVLSDKMKNKLKKLITDAEDDEDGAEMNAPKYPPQPIPATNVKYPPQPIPDTNVKYPPQPVPTSNLQQPQKKLLLLIRKQVR